tara:strand:+ start:90 stop:374 length:285 start_codon:yes stop_codon:yes gene_type:complete
MDLVIAALLIALYILIATFSIHFYIVFLINDANEKMWLNGDWKYAGKKDSQGNIRQLKISAPFWNSNELLLSRIFNKFRTLLSYLNPFYRQTNK